MIQKRDDVPADAAEAGTEREPEPAVRAPAVDPAQEPGDEGARDEGARDDGAHGDELAAANEGEGPDANEELTADVEAAESGLARDADDEIEPDPAASAEAGDDSEASDGSSDAEDDDAGADGDTDTDTDDGPRAESAEEAADRAAAEDELGQPAAEDEAEAPKGSGRPLPQRVEAILFAAAAPLAPAKLARVLDEPLDAVKAALEELVELWSAREGAIDLVAIAGGWRFMTRPEFQVDLAGMAKKGKVEKLSPAALETLAIVAYKQPLTRAEVEGIRGVAAGPLLRVLLDRDLIRVSGRSPEPGHPLLYGTTKRFLDHFGLDSLRSLPDIKDLLDVS